MFYIQKKKKKKETNNTQGIYWSVENNGIGEAAPIVINDFGEENIPGLFVLNHTQRSCTQIPKGFNTTHSTKIQHVAD